MWDTFWTLSNARQIGMNGPQPITIADVMAFCAMAGIADPADRMMILYGVQAMDSEFRRFIVEKQKQEAKKK